MRRECGVHRRGARSPMADSNETVTIATGEGANGTTLLGIGAYRPGRVVSNEEICETIDSTTEWIYERSGILNRRFANDDESVIMMASAAAEKAVASAEIGRASCRERV